MKKKRNISMAKIYFFLLKLFCIVLFFALITAVATLYYFSRDLPNHNQLSTYLPPVVSRLYSADNLVLAEYFKEYRIFLQIKDIPKLLSDTLIAVEDQSFYSNPGLDFTGIARSMLINISNGHNQQSLVGGSTITQQVIKNFLLDNEKSFSRKIKEAILAVRLNATLSKEQIMELYLNKIYFGHGSYGVAAAALKYFNKSVGDLSIEEIALLAGLPQAPSRLDPFHYPIAATERRNWVLNRMFEKEVISSVDYIIAKSKPLALSDQRLKQTKFSANFFADEIKRQLLKTIDKRSLMEDGLFIRSTLDSKYQKLAEEAVTSGLRVYDRLFGGWRGNIGKIENIQDMEQEEWLAILNTYQPPPGSKEFLIAVIINTDNNGLKIGLTSGEISYIPNSELAWIYSSIERGNIDPRIGDVILVGKVANENYYTLQQVPQVNGSLIMMDANTGKVLAMVGGYDYERSEFNVASQAFRQPGSVFKPFIYLSALEDNITTATLINDDQIEMFQGPYLPLWRPKNYNDRFYGDLTLRRGLELSQNTIAVQIANFVGINKIIDTAKKFSIYKSADPLYSLALGTKEVSLLDMTAAYGMIANGGFHITPRFIEVVCDREGRVIANYEQNAQIQNPLPSYKDLTLLMPPSIKYDKKRIIKSSIASQMTFLLQSSVLRGTSRGVNEINKNIAAKTGTTNNGVDNWFIGFWQNIVVGVYVGFDKPQTLGKNATGARVAMPIFRSFMKEVLRDTVDMPFRSSPEFSFIRVNKNTGLLADNSTNPSQVITEVFENHTEQIHYSLKFKNTLQNTFFINAP